MTIQKIMQVIGIGLIIGGSFLLIWSFIPINPGKYRKPDSELRVLTSYLINPPKYFKRVGKENRTFLRLELDQLIGAYFENEDEFLEATDWQAVLKEIKYHDTVTIRVLKDQFEKNYQQRSSLSPFELAINHPSYRFSFYSLQCRGKEYVGDIYKIARQRRKHNQFLFTVVYVLITGAGVGLTFIRKLKY
jgi:hypothetical protein